MKYLDLLLKMIEVHDRTGNADDRYTLRKQIRFKTPMLRPDLWDYSDAYIVAKGDIVLTETYGRGIIDIRNSFLAFKNNAPCISKINNVLIDNTEDLDIAMPICLNTAKITEKPQEVFGIITEMNRT